MGPKAENYFSVQDPPPPPPPPKPDSKSKLSDAQPHSITIVKSNQFENLIINNNSGNGSNGAVISNKMNFINIANAGQLMASKPQTLASNLSNFLVVRFELSNNQETSSKSKSKYKKSIKIISVSSKPLKYFETGGNCPDIQLKTFEFTEKCLSFRLACLDLNPTGKLTKKPTEIRSNFSVKIINLYEKYLIALVNFKRNRTDNEYKLFRIKHEETASSLSTDKSGVKEIIPNETLITLPEPPQVLTNQNCLMATSSSRLNLTEFILCTENAGSMENVDMECRVLILLPISVTTFDDEDDLKYIATLDEFGTISKCWEFFSVF